MGQKNIFRTNREVGEDQKILDSYTQNLFFRTNREMERIVVESDSIVNNP